MLCFDNNTATEVTQACAQAMWLSVASQDVQKPLEQISDCVQELLWESGTVVVTSGAEEALTLLAGEDDLMYTAVGDPLYALTRQNADTTVHKADYGFLTLANEEYGVIYDVATQSRAMKRTNPEITTVLDATQGVGRMHLHPLPPGIDAVIIDSKTCYCGPGLAALWVRDASLLKGRFSGGFQQGGLRPGALNPMHLAGFAAGIREIQANSYTWVEYIARLRITLDSHLQQVPGLTLNYADMPLLCNTSNYHVEGIQTKALALGLRRSGLRISDTIGDLFDTTLCTPLTTQRFEVEARYSNLRISLSALNTPRDVEKAVALISRAVHIARRTK